MFTGLVRGLQLMADFLKFVVTALQKANAAAVADCVPVAKQWIAETVNEAGAVKISAWSLAFNSDPWKTSRTMWEALRARYPNV